MEKTLLRANNKRNILYDFKGNNTPLIALFVHTTTRTLLSQRMVKAKKATTKINAKERYTHLFEQKKREVGIGRGLPFKTDLTRFVKWPKYVQLQRQRRILFKRMSIPPMINQFTKVANKPFAHKVVSFLKNYAPETKSQKKERQQKEADKQGTATPKSRSGLLFGINEIVSAVEKKSVQLVVIPHDADPIELVLYLPALCVKLGIPYVIVKSKSRLGEIVGLKKVAAVAIENVKKEHRDELAQIVEVARQSFNDQFSNTRKTWGGKKLSKRSTVALKKREIASQTQ